MLLDFQVKWLGPRNQPGAVCVIRGRPSLGASAVLKGASLAPLRFLHAHSCLVASNRIKGSGGSDREPLISTLGQEQRGHETHRLDFINAKSTASVSPLLDSMLLRAVLLASHRARFPLLYRCSCRSMACHIGPSARNRHRQNRWAAAETRAYSRAY